MRTCRACAYWKPTDDNRSPNGFGTCAKLIEYGGYHLWRDADEITSRLVPPLNTVVVETDEGWGLFTGPEFSCLHFQARTEPEGKS